MARGGGGRAAEHVGRRTSSCIFADNIAKASIAAYNAALASVPEPARSDAFGGGRQTVLAAVVARDERLDALRVVSLGAGTKFMSAVDIEADAEAGARVRDSHAEVLARRGLKRFLYAQLAAEAGRSHREPSPVATGRKRTREGEEPGSFTAPATEPGSRSARDDASQTWSVLERAGERYRVRPSVTFHLYTSSAPCGNATVKRWAKGAKERFVDGLGAFETPPGSDDHGRPSWSAVKEGQIAFLYKKDPGSAASEELASEPSELRGTGALGTGIGKEPVEIGTDTDVTEKGKTSPRDVTEKVTDVARFVPPGASTTGRVLTCSDKIATWSCVGLQGALLASLLAEPVYLASVTVGRKFNQAILRRALCCRVHRFIDPNGAERSAKETEQRAKETEQAKGSSPSSSFGVRHPSVMCTAVPFDLGAYAEGEGAVFDRREALAWWLEDGGPTSMTPPRARGTSRDDELSGDEDDGVVGGIVGVSVGVGGRWEVLDGRAGVRLMPDGRGTSSLSRVSLLATHRFVVNPNLGWRDAKPGRGDAAGGTYADAKRSAGEASGYWAAKRRAMSQPGLWALSELPKILRG